MTQLDPIVREPTTLEHMYGESDLAEAEVFKGGYCNFGYWPGIPNAISAECRSEASKALYREVLNLLGSIANDGHWSLLEVGAGRGHGARLAIEEYGAGRVLAVDQSPMQIERLRRCQRDLIDSGRLDGQVGTAEDLPASSSAYDALYSVEAMQHFQSNRRSLEEAARVLKPGGKLALTTFFLTRSEYFDRARTMLPTVERGITRLTPIEALVHELEMSGFHAIRVQSIGAKVFPGFDRWLEILGDRAGERDSWGRNWLKCHQAGWIDYYLIDACRSRAPAAAIVR
ncbi:MAG: class I SAM-dependent methyltransferase [Candidatus Binataceae bacterium]